MGYWTFERVCRNASAFETRSEFQRRSNTAYVIAYRRGWLDIVCAHMTPAGNRVRRFVYQITSTETKEVYVGLTAHPGRRYAGHRSTPKANMKRFIERPHTFEVITPEPIPARDAAAMESALIDKFLSGGWRVLNIAKAGGLGGTDAPYWTIERLTDEARKHADRGEMKANSESAYVIASRLGVLDRIFAGHANAGLAQGRKKNGHWTAEAIQSAASECTTRGEFRDKHPGAYLVAARTRTLDTIFANHVNAGIPHGRLPWGYWTDAKLIEEAKQHASRRDLQATNPGAYAIAWKRGLLDAMFTDHPNEGFIGRPAKYAPKTAPPTHE